MKKALYIFTPVIITAILFSACKKKDNATPNTTSSNSKFTGCRISQISEAGFGINGTNVYTFTYNNDGTVATITSHPDNVDVYVTTVTYNKNYVIAYTTDNGLAYSKDSIALNAQGKVINIDYYSYNGEPPAHEIYDQYSYDSSENLVAIISYNYNTVSTQNFQWVNGNIEWLSLTTDFYSYVYGTNLYSVGNITARLTDLENYGIATYTFRNLYTMMIMDNTDTFNYAYTLDTLDTSGKLTKAVETESGNYTHTTEVTYDCQ